MSGGVHALIPPKDIRIWVGPFEDEQLFLQSGQDTVALMVEMANLQPAHSVLDVGCGCGRVALALADFLAPAGRYVGFDPAVPLIRWCKEYIEPRFPSFQFHHVDVRSPGVHPQGTIEATDFRFPYTSGSFDTLLLSSVFTHMLPSGVEAYTPEIARVLRPRGRCLISHLLMNDAARRAVEAGTTRFSFRHPLGPCMTFAPDNPTEGVAYDEQYALTLLRENGLEIEEVRYGNWRSTRSYAVTHDWITASKRRPAVQPPPPRAAHR
jgi:SAM-dependent methyltransferase